MMTQEIRSVLVVGSGAMGSQIAMVCALAGLEVAVHDLDDAALIRAEEALQARMGRDVDKGRRTQADVDAAWSRLTVTSDLPAAAAGADFVIEAVVEKLEVKRALFEDLDRLCRQHAILTSNSSSFVPSLIAEATARPDRVCNMHFFNPALVMACVEVVRGRDTSEETMAATTALARRLGKEPVVLDQEINGFVANRILNAIRDEAIFLLEGGYASIEAIDTACRTALGHPMGPFELQDLTGLDVGYHVRMSRYADSGDERDLPSRSLEKRYRAGHLGRKTGQGWYRYDESGKRMEATA
jgi:3-hydroxybutyryl-CoA dehydrogenase